MDYGAGLEPNMIWTTAATLDKEQLDEVTVDFEIYGNDRVACRSPQPGTRQCMVGIEGGGVPDAGKYVKQSSL